jgi:hypothetical protein
MASLQEQIESFKNEYYRDNGGKKSSFVLYGKSSQKADLAQKVSQEFDIQNLLEQTIFLINDTNKIMIDYTIFKQYANDSNYDIIISHMLTKYDYCINTFGTYSVHINLATFTTTAAERYRRIIELFNRRFVQGVETIYMRQLEMFYVYNPPSMLQMIHNILKPVMSPRISTKTQIIPKTESEEKLAELFTVKNG